jgi:glutathione S-transferase
VLVVQGFSRVPELVCGLTRDLRILWALEEYSLPYRFEGLDFQLDIKSAEHRERSPFGQVPTIEDDGLVLSESGAILNYIAEKAGVLHTGDIVQRHEMNRWCYAALCSLEPPILFLNWLAFSGAGTKELTAQLEGWAKMRLGEYNGLLATQPYMVATGFSIADILVVTVLRQIGGMGLTDNLEHLVAYQTRCEQRPAWQRVLDAQEDRLGVSRGAGRRLVPERQALMQRA